VNGRYEDEVIEQAEGEEEVSSTHLPYCLFLGGGSAYPAAGASGRLVLVGLVTNHL
jgi:hypothetical protein